MFLQILAQSKIESLTFQFFLTFNFFSISFLDLYLAIFLSLSAESCSIDLRCTKSEGVPSPDLPAATGGCCNNVNRNKCIALKR